MKLLNRNKKTIKYALYKQKARLINADGTKGEYINEYYTPVEKKMYVSASRGQAEMEMFGVSLDYTKTLITDDMTCPMDEHTILWVDNVSVSGAKNDYVVVQVAKSLNYITYAIKEVDVSA